MEDDHALTNSKGNLHLSQISNGRYMTSRLAPCPLLLILLLLTITCRIAFGMCPARCRCNDDELHASCAGAKLQFVPIQLNPEVKHINLSDNKINNVDYTLPIYSNLITLDISFNKVQKLGSKNFISQHHLKTLNLSYNQIENLERDVFKGLKSLQVLDLSSNSIDVMYQNAFHDLHQLQVLYLANNKIISFENDLFKHQTNLRILDLNNNQFLDIPTSNLKYTGVLERLILSNNLVNEINEHSLPALKHLCHLSLDRNIISEIHNKAFDDFQNMQYLNLADNNFTEIPTKQLSKLANLTELNLSGNFIRAIAPVAFRGLFKLNKLELERLEVLTRIDARAFIDNINLETVLLNNNIALSIFPTRTFHGNPRITHISIRNNKLSSLDASHFPLDQLRTLELSGNPFHCNCSLLWLWKLEKEQLQRTDDNVTADVDDLFLDIDGIRCAQPEQLAHELLVEVVESEIQCSLNWLIAIITASAIVFSILVSIMAVYIFYGNLKCCKHKKRLEQTMRESSNACPNRFSIVYEEAHQPEGSKFEIDRYIMNAPAGPEYQSLPHWEILNKNKDTNTYRQFGFHAASMQPPKPHIVYV